MHRRDAFDPSTRRVMHRTQLKGKSDCCLEKYFALSPGYSIVLFDLINLIGAKSLSDQRKIDPVMVRDHIETVIETHEQVFEKFFLAKFLGLKFDYLPADATDCDKDHLRVSFEVTEMLMNPQGSLHGGIMAWYGYFDGPFVAQDRGNGRHNYRDENSIYVQP